MMSKEYLDEVLMQAQGRAEFWFDTLVPVHLRSNLIEGEERIYMGSLQMAAASQFNLLRQIIRQNYECSSKEAEMRFYPELPSQLNDINENAGAYE